MVSKGAWIQLGSLDVFRIINEFPFDYIVIDHEHGIRQNIELFPLLKENTKLLCRTKSRDTSFFSWLLDVGYDGIVLADVRDEDEVVELIRATYFEPFGNRGLGFSRQNRFSMDIKKYTEFNPILGLQFESEQGIKKMSAILDKAAKQIFFCMLGPYDLSKNLGIPGDFKSKTFLHQASRFRKHIEKFKIKVADHYVGSELQNLNEMEGLNDILFYETDSKFIINSLYKIFK